MTAIYLVLGIFIAILGALPLGAVNIVVINTSINENTRNALYIAVAAGISEIMLALLALHCSMELSGFFKSNKWVQILFIVTFLVIGIYFLMKNEQPKRIPKIPFNSSKFFTGFSLGFLNPPVVLYWVLAISLINKYFIKLTPHTSFIGLALFFTGIYLGKIITLYAYSIWGNKMAKGKKGTTNRIYRIIGISLVIISVFQGARFLIV